MSVLCKKSEEFRKKRDGLVKKESLTDSTAESRESSFSGSNSSSSCSSNEEAKAAKGSSSPSPPAPPLGWPILKAAVSKCGKSDEKDNDQEHHLDDTKFSSIGSKVSDAEMSCLVKTCQVLGKGFVLTKVKLFTHFFRIQTYY
ncbi:uncharacterized protein [Arachis hypogaea]|uniref:uncharacterized protein n=1 Tax=Arachis hypogaea TaxID=3818 RepID=UPI000DEC0807|nr:rop guanine nucleotide exchange factor 5-like [Arachis hypogaea]QHO39624.1 Rop guanine nucleotide exchange factor [Arachis hypogaea]